MLKAEEAVDIFVPFEGQVKTVGIAEGQHVTAGQVLFVLDAPDLSHRLRQIEARAKRKLRKRLTSLESDAA